VPQSASVAHWVGAGCSVDAGSWSPSAECRRWWVSSAFQWLLTTGACASDQNSCCCEHLAAWRRQAPPPDLPEGVEVLDAAMAAYVVAVRREPFSGRSDPAS
jgi:hypothetical protein